MKNNRTERMQVMVTESLADKIRYQARKLGLSTSSYLELVIGHHIAAKDKDSIHLVDEKVI